MDKKLKVLGCGENDFAKIKADGFYGVVIKDVQAIKPAKQCGLKVFRVLSAKDKSSTRYLDKNGVYEGDMCCFSKQSFREYVNLDDADGFILQAPHFTGLLWDNSFEREYRKISDTDFSYVSHLIFDSENNLSIREWYYTQVSKLCIRKYLLPVMRLVKNKELVLTFESETFYGELLKRASRNVQMKYNTGIVTSAKDDIVTITYAENPAKCKCLVISPYRLLLRSYVYGKRQTREETPQLLAFFEEKYYKDSLKKCGYSFRIIGEQELKHMKISEMLEFENIIICENCIFCDDEIKKIKNVQRKGALINDRKLLIELDKVNS